jgi:hypothetical protein
MALTVKSLGRGAVPTTQGDIVGPVGTGKAVIVKSMRFVNTSNSAAATLNVYFKRSGNTYRLLPTGLTMAAASLVVDDSEVTLEAGDSVQAVVASGNTVDYVISGIERDA